MEPVTLKLYAHIPSGAAWAFFVADEASGLKLPIVRETFVIRVINNIISIHCELDLDLRYDNFMELTPAGDHLVCEQGFLKLLSPAVVDVQEGRETINCVIMLDGFSGKEAKQDGLFGKSKGVAGRFT